MKLKSFKQAVFLITILVLFLTSVLFYRASVYDLKNDVSTLKVATFYKKSSKFIDPIQFETAIDYSLARNLYSPLVEYDENGNIIPGVADSFHWDGQNLVFTFTDKAKTNKGKVLTASDAEKSLRRTFLLDKKNHGSLRSFICQNEGESFNGICSGIHVSENKLIMTVKKDISYDHVIEVLTSADFSIIPSLPDDVIQLKDVVLNHAETSGPYFVDQDDENGNFHFKANKFHYHYSEDIPQSIQFVSTHSSADHGSMLLNGEIDLATTVGYVSKESLKNIREQNSRFSVHETIPICVHMVVFTPSAVKKFSFEHRAFAAELFKKYYLSNSVESGMKNTNQFFQYMSDGNLDKDQEKVINEMLNLKKRPSFTVPIQYGVPEYRFESLKEYFKPFPEVEVVKRSKSSFLSPIEDRSDMYFITNDSAWTESVGLLNYNFNNGIFHIPGFDFNVWMSNYMKIQDRSTRVKMLSDLHFKILQAGSIFPFSVSPYHAVARKPWEIKMSTLFAGTPLWQIHKKKSMATDMGF